MIEKRWINIATIVSCVGLLLFAMLQTILALVLNINSQGWVNVTDTAAGTTTSVTTGINILIDALFVFPTAWAGISAALSRHRGVYILLLIIGSLALLGTIGGIVDIAYEFDRVKLFRDPGSYNDEIGISMFVMRCVEMLIILMVLGFGIAAVLSGYHDKPKYRQRSREMLVDEPAAPYGPTLMRAPSYASYQPQAITAAALPPPQARYPTAATAGGFRQYTQGSPEWDRFYAEYFGHSGGKSNKHRSNSYRY